MQRTASLCGALGEACTGHGDLHMPLLCRSTVTSMSHRRAFLLVGLLLLNSLALVVTAQGANGRGGSKDDFLVNTITVGNASSPAATWIQPDGASMPYLFMDESVEITVEVRRLGNAQLGKSAPVTLEVVHPIGYVMQTWSWNTSELLGSIGSDSASVVWTPDVAHSILNTTTNELHGGLVLRASVEYPQDDRNENDVKEQAVPIAIQSDAMDGIAGTSMGFIPGRYSADGGGASGRGSWTTDGSDASNSDVGSKHWRHSQPGSNYPSNAHDRLVRGFFTTTQDCGPGAALDGELSYVYQIYACRDAFYANSFVSTQFHLRAWGATNNGDAVSIEMWRPPGQYNDPMQSLHWNLTKGAPAIGNGEWTNLSWDPQVDWAQIPTLSNPDIFLGGNTWYYGLLFHSDSSGAGEGMHVDDFIQFGISKVDEFTLDVDCNNPENGFSSPPNGMLVLKCDVTNNGYKPAPVRVFTDVSNPAWMSPYLQIRIDADLNPNDHDNNVILQNFDAGMTTTVWLNLSIPPGSDVQTQDWNVTFYDHGNGDMKGMLSIPVGVTEQHSVQLSSNTALLADNLYPSESGLIPFRLQNTGNREANYRLNPIFSESGWDGVVVNDTGVPVQMPIALSKGESLDLHLNVTAYELAAPGEVSFNLRATCPTCSGALFGTDVLVRNIEVPVLRSLDFTSETYEITGSANGQARVIPLTLMNTGNAEEQYTFELQQSNWLLRAELLSEQTAMLDAWDGEANVALRFNMPLGLEPGFYTATVVARNVNDNTVGKSLQISVEILDTAAVTVLDEDADQSYIPGDPPQSMEFEVRNDGNKADRFNISLVVPEGMVAEAAWQVSSWIAPGASENVSVSFSFISGTEGELQLGVTATSQNDPSISDTGNALYRVGSQNWLRIPSVIPLEIDTADADHFMELTVRNQYTTAQAVAMELDAGEAGSYMQVRINSQDRNFVLQVGEERKVTVELIISDTTLVNLDEDRKTVNFTVWARSETVSDAADAQMTVTMVRTSLVDSTDDETEGNSGAVRNVIMILLTAIVVVVGGLAVMRIIGGIEEDAIDDWADDGYEDSLQATYAGVKAAPSIPSEAPPAGAPPAAPAPAPEAPAPPAEPAAPAAPPVPAEGLPEGWSMEQWQTYGHMWLEQNGRA